MKVVGICLALVAIAPAQQFASSSWNVKAGEVTAVFGPPRPAPILTGAPYSADEVQDCTPPDGNSSPRSNIIGHFARDAQGRTRIERAYKPAPIWLTEIFDPVAGVAFILDDQNRIAHRMSLPPPAAATAPPANPRATIERLDNQSIEGFMAEGTRTEFGGPLDTGRPALTLETWESPELKLTLLTRSSNGYISRLTNLSRTEPDAALFRPSSGYTVVDEKNPFPLTVQFQ
jgi:hypothetical protein